MVAGAGIVRSNEANKEEGAGDIAADRLCCFHKEAFLEGLDVCIDEGGLERGFEVNGPEDGRWVL